MSENENGDVVVYTTSFVHYRTGRRVYAKKGKVFRFVVRPRKRK